MSIHRWLGVSLSLALLLVGCRPKDALLDLRSAVSPTDAKTERDAAKDSSPPAPRRDHPSREGEFRQGPVSDFTGPTRALPKPKAIGKPTAQYAAGAAAAAVVTSPVLDAKLAVLSYDGNEYELAAIKQSLDFLGTPYSVITITQLPATSTGDHFTTSMFYDGSHAFYQGVILTNNVLENALTANDWAILRGFETSFAVRQVTWYSYPTADLGFDINTITSMDTTTTPLNLSLVAVTGPKVFIDVATAANSITLTYSWVYRAKALNDGRTTILAKDAAGNALIVTRKDTDGRENLATTFATSIYVPHHNQLAYGIINWVTKGIFLGERHAYLAAQVDDYFLEGDMYGGGTYRLTATDLTLFNAWQNTVRLNAQARTFMLDLVFNGEGVNLTSDNLSKQSKARQANFRWINHTYSHLNLDAATYAETAAEMTQNFATAKTMGFNLFSRANFVSPDVSGLTNSSAMQALYDNGIRYVVSDTSRPEGNNPTPNTGRYSAPGVLQIPRHPVNIFWDCTNQAQEVAEYNAIYRAFWGRDLTYTEIIDKEAEMIVNYMMKWDMDPLMFHQGNLRGYNSRTSLLGDLVNAVITKYTKRMKLNIVSLPMDQLGARMANRMKYNASGVTAQIRPGQSITITTTANSPIPVTGVYQAGAENYGGQYIYTPNVTAGTPVTIPLGAYYTY